MQYANFDYYTHEFGGDELEEQDFDKYAKRASRLINRYTYGRIDEKHLSEKDYASNVKDCTCALAERINELEIEDEEGKVASESVGPHSVSYRSEAKLTTAQKMTEYRTVLDLYLFNTGLMYAGLGCPHAWNG